jgi:hypothetical protein
MMKLGGDQRNFPTALTSCCRESHDFGAAQSRLNDESLRTCDGAEEVAAEISAHHKP